MNRPILVCALFVAAAAALGAQQANQSSPYQGTSNPPPDDMIITNSDVQPKPPAGHPATAQQQESVQPPAQLPAQPQGEALPPPAPAAANDSTAAGSDDGIVQVGPGAASQSGLGQPDLGQRGLNERAYAGDADGDIVHPQQLGPGQLAEGTVIRVRLLGRLSTTDSEEGETFRTKVASDVLQAGGAVVIPAGSEIDGRVVKVSSGHPGGHGSMRLRPETVILPDGSRCRLLAEVTGAPGARARVDGENTIVPDSRLKQDSVEYGSAVGVGAVTGAIVGGPAGAVAGTAIGAGVVTAHLLISHPEATLEEGATLLFTLTDQLSLVPASAGGN